MFPVPIFSSNVGVAVGNIGHSLRCRSAASAYLSKTIAASANPKQWTFSFWAKRGAMGAALTQALYSAQIVAGNSEESIAFYNDVIRWADSAAGISRASSALFRDGTSHLHFVVVYDSQNATDSDRLKLYANGSQISFTGSAITQNRNSYFTTTATNPIALGRFAGINSNHFDGYLSRIAFVDGSSLTPSSFGYFNTEINEWVSKSQAQVKAVVEAGGTNSFMLDFDDGTSLTTLGYDKSSKGNNWTLNNFSLTAGVTYDWLLDVPGNSYAVLNPLIPSAANITNGNLSSGTTAARGTLNSTAFNSQWFVTAGASAVTAGVIDASGTASTISVTANKVFAFKMTTAGALSYKNVTDAGGWTSIATGLTGNRWPYSITQAASWNFGQQPLPEALDTGFLALCQANMPEPAIKNPEKHFDVVLATGANIKSTAEAVFPSNFLELIKDRANSNNHQLIDTVRGTSAVLQSNTTAAETTYSAPTGNSVGFALKAGGAAVANNAGSVSSQVSANVEAGFSIVTYTGTGANATVGHGLGKAPRLVIAKGKNYAGVNSNWLVNDPSAPWTKALTLNTTNASLADATFYNNTAPTSTVVTIGLNANQNANTYQYVAYYFAEIPGYSKIGSYTGNGSTDGPYVECGFKPKFVMVKRTDTTSDWTIWDAARNIYNPEELRLWPNLAGAESGLVYVDFTSNGFKLRDAAAAVNGSGGTFIFIAFADVPAKYSLSR